MRVLAFGVLPGVVLLLAMAAGTLKWRGSSARDIELARTESVKAAADSAVAVVSYRPETVERDVAAAQRLLTGGLRDRFTRTAHDQVILEVKARQVSAAVSVPGAASVTATENYAVVLVFIDQTFTKGQPPPPASIPAIG